MPDVQLCPNWCNCCTIYTWINVRHQRLVSGVNFYAPSRGSSAELEVVTGSTPVWTTNQGLFINVSIWPRGFFRFWYLCGTRNKALSDIWCNVKFSFCFTSKYKAIWKENLIVNQTSLRAFFHAPLQVEISIPENCFHSITFSPWNQASKFALQPCLSKLAEFLGLVTDDVKIRIFVTKVPWLQKFLVINDTKFLGYRCLVQIPHGFLLLGNHFFIANLNLKECFAIVWFPNGWKPCGIWTEHL